MPDLRKLLEQVLHGAGKIAVLAVGSHLRGDDAAGLLVAEKLEIFSKNPRLHSRFRILMGETAPENLTGVIRTFNPDHLIIVDSADMGKKPGMIFIVSPKEVAGISFSTHQLPLKLMIQYLNESISCAVTIVGIQPGNLHFGSPVSKEVRKSAAEAAAAIKKAVQGVFHSQRTAKKRVLRPKRA